MKEIKIFPSFSLRNRRRWVPDEDPDPGSAVAPAAGGEHHSALQCDQLRSVLSHKLAGVGFPIKFFSRRLFCLCVNIWTVLFTLFVTNSNLNYNNIVKQSQVSCGCHQTVSGEMLPTLCPVVTVFCRRLCGDLVQGRPGDQRGQFQGAEGSKNISAAPAGGGCCHQHQVPSTTFSYISFSSQTVCRHETLIERQRSTAMQWMHSHLTISVHSVNAATNYHVYALYALQRSDKTSPRQAKMFAWSIFINLQRSCIEQGSVSSLLQCLNPRLTI